MGKKYSKACQFNLHWSPEDFISVYTCVKRNHKLQQHSNISVKYITSFFKVIINEIYLPACTLSKQFKPVINCFHKIF